jgi:putative ABC transport system substrate-binding protein
MRRREFITLLGGAAAAWPVAAHAQQPIAVIPIVGWISPATSQSYSQPKPGNPGPHQLREALAKLGLVDGKNIRIDMRLAEGRLDRLPHLAEVLVREGVTVILAFGEEAGRAAQSATRTLPIVCIGDDLVNSGLAASLAKPGSNLTGGSILATDLDTKKIEVLKELLPNAKRFGVLNDPATTGLDRPREMAEIARRLGIELHSIDIRGPADLEPAFRAFQSSGAEGVNVVSSAMLTSFRQRLGELSIGAKVPAICQWQTMVEAGCLASYGITISELYSIAADQISKLLKGAIPSDLPVQQPTKFQLVINSGVAKILGLPIPPTLLARADEVIE